MEKTKLDNKFIEMFEGNRKVKVDDIQKAMERSKEYENAKDDEIEKAAQRVYDKLKKINKEYLGWFEVLLAVVFMILSYMSPIALMKFQLKMELQYLIKLKV